MKKTNNLKELLSEDSKLYIQTDSKTYEVESYKLSNDTILVQTIESSLRTILEDNYSLILKGTKGRYVAKKVDVTEVKGVMCSYKITNINFEKQELRNYKRVSYLTTVIVEALNNEIEGYMYDFSAGGAFLKLDTSIKILKGNLSFSVLNQELYLPFTVVRSYKDKNSLCVHIKFDNLNDKTIQKLCKLVFQIEIEQRKYKKDL